MFVKGYKMTEEHKRKISESHKSLGDLHWSKRPEVRLKQRLVRLGERNHNFGKPMSTEQKEKISESNKGKHFLSPEKAKKMVVKKFGSDHWTQKKWGQSWAYTAKQIRTRDNYICQICGLRDTEIMEVDHIRPKSLAPELYKRTENLMCICPNCHSRKTKRDRKQIAEQKSIKLTIL